MNIVFILLAVVVVFVLWQGQARARRLAFIRNFNYEKINSPKLRAKLSYLNDAQIELAQEGLKQYFLVCCRARRRMVSMPSQVVDEFWHEFILNTRAYKQFCNRAFGRFLHHIPAQAMHSPTLAQEGIKRAWRLACTEEKINPKFPTRLPLLFALDAMLHVPEGFYYQLNCNKSLVAAGSSYCASDIGCGGGCASGGADGSSCGSSDSGCGSGCGGGD